MSRFHGNDDARFEQALLDAERRSPDAPDVDHAWSRFRTSVGMLGSGLEQASGVHDIHPDVPQRRAGGEADADASGLAPGPSEPVAGLAAGKLLTLGAGAAIGCVATLAAVLVMEREQEQPPPVLRPPQAVEAPVTQRIPTDEVPVPPSSPEISPIEPPATRLAPSTATPSAGSAVAKPPPEGAARSALRSSDSQAAERANSAQLSAQVEHLDWLRRLSASGEHGQVLRSVTKFHERFPRGALAPEAEVLALRSLVALGKADELARRAAVFERRYPQSPHLQRVHDWVE